MFQFLGLMKYLPLLFTVIPLVEQIMGNKEGVSKKNAVIELIVQVAPVFGITVEANDLEVVSKLIDRIVSVFNKTGVFVKPDVALLKSVVGDDTTTQPTKATPVAPRPSVLDRAAAAAKPVGIPAQPVGANDSRLDELEKTFNTGM